MRELQNLYGVLLEQDLISIDFNQFASKINDENYKEKVYDAIMQGNLYSGSYVDFQNKFIPTQASTTTPRTSSRRKPTKTEQPEQQEPTFVNEEFWKTQKYAREDYTYRDGKWYYKNPKTGKEVSISETTSNDTSQRLQELQKEREAEFNYKKSKLEVEQDVLNKKEEKTDEDIQKQLELEKQLSLLNQESIVDENQKNLHKKKLGGSKMPKVTKDITERDDERAIKFLNEKYAEYGFIFEVDEDFKDRVLVTSTYNEEGKQEQTQEYFTFDQGFIFDSDKLNSAEAKRMDKWMRKRAFKTTDVDTYQNIFTQTETQEQIDNKTQDNLSYYGRIKDAFSNYEIEKDRNIFPSYIQVHGEYIQDEIDKLSELSDDELQKWISKNLEGKDSRLNTLYAMEYHGRGDEEAMLMAVHGIIMDNGLGVNPLSLRPYDYEKPLVVKETDQAVKNGIIQTAIQRWEKETGLKFDDENPDHGDAIRNLTKEIESEWKQMKFSDDEAAMLESDLYQNILNGATRVTRNDNIRKRVRDYAENQDGNVVFKGTSQKISGEAAEKEFNALQEKSKKLLQEQSAFEESITNSDKKLKET